MARGALYSIMGMYQLDPTIFDNLQVPEEVDTDALINKLLIDCAELEIVYPNCEMMKESLGYWSKAHLRGWEMYAATLEKSDYDPFTDFDRHEEFTEHYTDVNDQQADSTASQRAFNEADLTAISGTNATAINNGSGDRTHTMRQYGNSALGTNQDIIKKEIELRQMYNLIDLIITQFKLDYCICVY